MMDPVILAAGAADPAVGPGRLIGLLAGAAGCWFIVRIDEWRKKRGGQDTPPSPTDPPVPVRRETPQVAGVSSQVSPDETTVERHWWGAIERVGNSSRRVYRTAQHVVRTGDSPPPEPAGELPEAYDPPDVPEPDDEIDDQIDLWIEDEPEYVQAEAPDESTESGAAGFTPAAPRETREQYAERCNRAGIDTPVIVAGLQRYYGLSRATAYRVARKPPSTTRAA
jgi:hypothetical protein